MVITFLLLLIALPALASKPNLAGPAAHLKFGDTCERLYLEIESKGRKGYEKGKRIRERYAEFRGISDTDNEKFLQRAVAANRGEKTDARIFLDIENAVLKDLNDKVIEDRELVTALTNLHKDVVWSEISSDPVLAAAMLDKYSDFKSLRFSFKSDDREIQARASALLSRINKKYSEYLDDLSEENGWKEKVKGLSADSRNWYHAGVGATPDQAGVATRFSRDNLSPKNVAVLRHFDEAAATLQQAAYNAGRFQKWVAKRYAGLPGFLVKSESGAEVLSAETIEAIKKAIPRYHEDMTDAVARALSARFRLKFSADDAKGLRSYLGLVDQFSPGLLQAKREVIDMGVAARGVISADFKGQNARNIQETMKALADTEGQHIKIRLQAVREGEIRATAALEAKKASFQRAMRRFAAELEAQKILSPAAGKKLKARFTGDDGVMFVPFELNPEARAMAQKILLEEMDAEDIRLAFVQFDKPGAEIAAEARSGWIVQAESLEKKLRVGLIEKMNRRSLNDLQIGVSMVPDAAGKGVVELQLLRKGERIVSVEEEKIILEMARAFGYNAKIMGMP